MSDYEYHRGKVKMVDLSEYDNDTEKYFEARYRDEFAKTEDRPAGMTEEEIQQAYQASVENKYRRRGAWEDLWQSETDCYCAVIRLEDEIWEVADIELDDFEDVFNKQSDTEYEYITSFYNGGCCLQEVLEDGLARALKRDRK